MPERFVVSDHVFAHRGLWGGDVPENSLAAFQNAAAAGFGAECDVHVSSDGIPMVFHDFDLKRLTGRDGKIKHTVCDALQSMALAGSNQTIPRLVDILAVMGNQPLLVELKSDASTDQEKLAAAVADAVSDYDSPLAIMSFDLKLMQIVGEMDSVPLLGYLLDPEKDWTQQQLEDQLANSPVDFLGPNVTQMDTIAPIAKTINKALACWTVRTEAEFRSVRLHGAAPIFENLATPLVRTLSIT